MKTIKLNHEEAEEIRQGRKAVTWRVYDDKDLSVNDTVALVDKVDPQKPDSWKVFTRAKVDRIVEKRLGDITAEERDEYVRLSSQQALIELLRTYYGPQVTSETPIRIVYFNLHTPKDNNDNVDANTTSILKEAKLYADGGSRGNPGPSASGFAVTDMDDKVVVKKGVYLGVTTNNQAEYQALKLGLEALQKMGAREVHVYMDSLLVINQMLGIFKVKNRDLWPIHDAIKQLTATFKHVSFTHVPRELNKVADAQVNEALDAAA